MWLTKFIQKLNQKSENTKLKNKTFKELDYLDSVWIREDGVLYEGWVFDITRRCIVVVYGHDLKDFRFRIDKTMNDTELEQDSRILYCNEPNEAYIKI